MPVDLTPGGQVGRLRNAVVALTQECEELRAQVQDLPTLYDELAARDEKIARLENRGIEDLQAQNEQYRAALDKIVLNGGRGGLRIAAAALEH